MKTRPVIITIVLILTYGFIAINATDTRGGSGASYIEVGGLSFNQGSNILTNSFGQSGSLCNNPGATFQPYYFLFQDGANTVSLGNTTTSNDNCDTNDDFVFRIYGEYFTPADWNAIQIKSDQDFANQFSIFTYSSSLLAPPRPLKFGVICSGSNPLCKDSAGNVGGALSWTFNTSNNFNPMADNVFDIGRTQAIVDQPGNLGGRPRNIYAGSQIIGPNHNGCATPSFGIDQAAGNGIDFYGYGQNGLLFCSSGDEAGMLMSEGFLVGRYDTSGPAYTGILKFTVNASGVNLVPHINGSGGNQCSLSFVPGTNPGTGKLIALCGTSNIPVTIADNIGAGLQ